MRYFSFTEWDSTRTIADEGGNEGIVEMEDEKEDEKEDKKMKWGKMGKHE